MRIRISRTSFAAEFYKAAVIFLYGGFIYGGIEILYRGHTHPSMFVLGGICLLWVGGLDLFLRYKLPLIAQMIAGGIFITAAEFIFGLIFNIWLGLRVWDYSKLPLNIMGQVCPVFLGAWILLSLPAVKLEDIFRRRLEARG